MSVVFIGNDKCKLPNWLVEYKPQAFDFNSTPSKSEYPETAQLDSVWRWIEGLPVDKCNATPLSVHRKRVVRLEHVDLLRDLSHYSNPALTGRETFRYRDYTVGSEEYQFRINFSGCSQDSVDLYTYGGLKAIGLITVPNFDPDTVDLFLTSDRTVSL
ncbi:hypothetical protein [Proteus terrae]|uniref:hypothetical protein n=1 Tax=Proteus terrae TaxID=1574161 RepID=UPI00301C4437